MNEIKIILSSIKSGAPNPGEVANRTNLPRYEVLVLFKVLEKLGLIETIYARGSHKVYKLTRKGEEILEGLEKGLTIDIVIKDNNISSKM
jgi:predicted transcriptional regulator